MSNDEEWDFHDLHFFDFFKRSQGNGENLKSVVIALDEEDIESQISKTCKKKKKIPSDIHNYREKLNALF